MRAFRIALLRLRSLVRSRRVEAELDDELRFHIERDIEAHVASGLSRKAARARALRDVGAVERWKEECRDQRGFTRLGSVGRDLRHTWRSVRARPGASLAVVLVLSLGLGLTSMMFALADPFVVRPLPYPNPDELVIVGLGRGVGQAVTRDTELPTVESLRARTDLFQRLTTFRSVEMRFRMPEGAAALNVLQVAPDTLELLGVQGTGFEHWPADDRSVETPFALTAAGLTALPGADVGTLFYRQDGHAIRVRAVLPPTFRFPLFPVIHGLVPMDPAPPIVAPRWMPNGRMAGLTTHNVLARLQPFATLESVQSAITLRSPTGAPVAVNVTRLTDRVTRSLRPLGVGALVAGLMILALCTANVANLLLARWTFRSQEFATRLALGASGRDIVQLVVVELAALVVVSLASGLVLAHFGLGATAFIIPDSYTALGTPAVTSRVVGFAALASVAIVTVGLVPSIAIWRLVRRVRPTQLARVDGRGIRSLRFLMAACQSAIAMILVAGAALLTRSVINLTNQDTGFTPDAVVVSVSYDPGRSGSALQQTIANTVERLRRAPGVSSVGAAAGSMVDGYSSAGLFTVDGQRAGSDIKYVTPGYFTTAGIELRAGRFLTDEDTTAGAVVINEALASRFWPGKNAVGQSLTWGARTLTVWGVARNSRDMALDAEPAPIVFLPFDGTADGFYRVNYLISAESTTPAAPSLRRAITDVDRDAIVSDVSTLGDRLLMSVNTRVFSTLVIVLFAVSGVSVCAAGLGGIVSFLVARRTREIAIRTAIGANAGHVRRLVMRQAVAASLVGLGTGALVGRWLSRSLASLLYGVQPGDWASLAAGGVFLLLIVLVATWWPATRALRISPTIALRLE